MKEIISLAGDRLNLNPRVLSSAIFPGISWAVEESHIFVMKQLFSDGMSFRIFGTRFHKLHPASKQLYVRVIDLIGHFLGRQEAGETPLATHLRAE